MPEATTLYVGRDVQQASMAVAYAASDHDAHVIYRGPMGTRQADSDHLTRPRHSQATHLAFAYEAGPRGYRLCRSLRTTGDVCWGVAPSLPPQQAGDRVTTGRRHAAHWARFMRAGDLTPASVPQAADEAIRDLPRAREDAIGELRTAQCRLKAFPLRHGIRYTGPATWGPARPRRLGGVVCPTPAQPMVFQEDVRAVTAHTERLQRLAQASQAHVKSGRLSPVVEARQALRGAQFAVAVTTVADLGGLTRFENPRPRMKDPGLIPSEYPSGERRRQGSLTTAGNTHARRALGEGAWAYGYPAKGSRPWPLGLEQLPTPTQDISWKAQVRRGTRVRRVMARGKHANQVVVAMARELVGFMWAMASQVPGPPQPGGDRRTHRCAVANVQGKRRGPGGVSPPTA